jgi:hypothetical protein
LQEELAAAREVAAVAEKQAAAAEAAAEAARAEAADMARRAADAIHEAEAARLALQDGFAAAATAAQEIARGEAARLALQDELSRAREATAAMAERAAAAEAAAEASRALQDELGRAREAAAAAEERAAAAEAAAEASRADAQLILRNQKDGHVEATAARLALQDELGRAREAAAAAEKRAAAAEAALHLLAESADAVTQDLSLIARPRQAADTARVGEALQDGVAAAAAAAKELTKNLPSAALGRISRFFGEADVGKAISSPLTILTPPRDLPPPDRLGAPLASQLPSAAAAADDDGTARVTATSEASPSAVTSPALADNGTAQRSMQRSMQAESAALRATLDAYEARLGRKLKKSDLAADPQMASTYHRYIELRQKYTDTV